MGFPGITGPIEIQKYSNFCICIMEIINKYFPDLSEKQIYELDRLWFLYRDWNQKINIISRKDIGFFYIRHVLHSMAILKVVDFLPGADILDVGTGGGFPGIPLAICCPESNFLLVDSVGKKIKVVDDVVDKLGLENVRTKHIRAEELKGRFDFITSRAVKSLPVFLRWIQGNLKAVDRHAISNGVLYLKGGNFGDELASLDCHYRIIDLSLFFSEDFFVTKKLVHLYLNNSRQNK